MDVSFQLLCVCVHLLLISLLFGGWTCLFSCVCVHLLLVTVFKFDSTKYFNIYVGFRLLLVAKASYDYITNLKLTF